MKFNLNIEKKGIIKKIVVLITASLICGSLFMFINAGWNYFKSDIKGKFLIDSSNIQVKGDIETIEDV